MISSITDEEGRSLKQAVLYELLPGIKLDMYLDSTDFVLCEERGDQHE